MKALWKMLVAGFIAMTLVGCGSMTGAAVGAHYGGPAGAAVGAGIGTIVDEHGVTHRGRQVAMTPSRGGCAPVQATALMAWATEFDDSYQKRTAKVSNDNGRVHCYSSESAGSQSGIAVRRAPSVGTRPADRFPSATVYEMR